MIIHPEFAGIDISKKYLDVFDGAVAKPERFDNTPETAKLLAKRFKKNRTCSLFEATGRYDRFLREAFSAAGLCFVRVNPARARDFARATGTLVKTDAIDARMLAAMAQTLSPGVFVPVAPNRQKLVDLQLRRDQLVAMRAEENTRLDGLDDKLIIAQIKRHIKNLAADIDTIEGKIQDVYDTDEELHAEAVSLRSVPGIGPVTASIFIALLPELGRCSPKAIAALAGLAPYNADSGSMRGKRKIRGGRPRVRKASYMAAIAAIRTKSVFASFYKKLIAAGKPPKVAIIAVARKILITANAIVRDKQIYAK
jgi:transposase